MNQTGGVSGSLRFPKTEGLGSTTTIAELKNTGALPGEVGVILKGRISFGEIYQLSTLGGRQVEFSLVRRAVNGRTERMLYSGDAWSSPIPRDGRLLAHTHPNVTDTQKWLSSMDIKVLNRRYFAEFLYNPQAKPKPSVIIWGPRNADTTVCYPGFGKEPLK